MRSNPFVYRGRGEPDPKWLCQDTPPKLPQREQNLFAVSCSRIDAHNAGLGSIVNTLREARVELIAENDAAWDKLS